MKTKNQKVTTQKWKPRSYTPEALYQVFVDYLAWAEDNPLRDKVVSKGIILELEKVRPLSLTGFCVYANIHRQTLLNYEKEGEDSPYFDVCARVRDVIEEQQLSGAMVGRFNPTIASRVLALADRQDITSNGKELNQEGLTINVDKDALSIIQSAGRISAPLEVFQTKSDEGNA